jgi:C1A family cysteine protease
MPIQSKLNRKYTWLKDSPDRRDQHLMFTHEPKLPPVTDLRPKCPGVYDQGEEGSCTANSTGGLMEYDLKQLGHDVMLSRAFLYYNGRAMEGTIQSDSGCQLRDVIKCAAKYGAPADTEWPYSDQLSAKTFATKPPPAVYADALKHKVVSYSRVARSLSQFRGCLYQGFPFGFGFQVFEEFESDKVAQTGILTLPSAHEEPLGGHAVACVGYDDTKQMFIVRNSWGASWGLQGYFMMPYAYLLDSQLSDDFWTIRSVLV